MERRIDRVRVEVDGSEVGLHWAEGVRLIIELKKGASTQALATRFEGAGTSTPVVVGGQDVDEVLGVLRDWKGRGDELPPGVEDLRIALHEAKARRKLSGP